MVRPMISFGAIAWAHRVENYKPQLRKVQRLALTDYYICVKECPNKRA